MRRHRRLLVLPGILVILGVLLWGYTGLPAFASQISEYGQFVDHTARSERHVTNFVAAVMFDYRGIDTLVEEFILFASVMGLGLLLRSKREVAEQRPRDVVTSDAVRTAGSAFAPVVLLFSLYVVSFGYLTPGGGFQGGVIASGGALLLWLAGSYRTFRAASPAALVDAAEGLGAASFVGVGLLGLAAGGTFLWNAIPLGSTGTLASGGTIAVLQWVSGLEVAGAFVLIYHEFLEEHIQTFAKTREEQQ